jgi:hypothetical protein
MREGGREGERGRERGRGRELVLCFNEVAEEDEWVKNKIK